MNAPTRSAAPRRRLGHAAPALALLLCLAACHAAPPLPPPAPATAPAQPDASTTLRHAIAAAVGDAPCDSTSQCRSSPLGAKACGGPDAYLAWSARHSDAVKLEQLLARYAAARRSEDRAAAMMSTCMAVSDPGATCQAGRCVLQPRGPGGPAVY